MKGREAMLLMEPIIPADTRLDQALQDIATTFSVYRFHLPQHVAASLIASVLHGAPERLREHVREELETSAHQVVELEIGNERDLFVRRIQSVGRSQKSTGHRDTRFSAVMVIASCRLHSLDPYQYLEVLIPHRGGCGLRPPHP